MLHNYLGSCLSELCYFLIKTPGDVCFHTQSLKGRQQNRTAHARSSIGQCLCQGKARQNCSILKWLADCDTGLIPTVGDREEGLDGVTDVSPERCLEPCSHSKVAHREVSFLDG